MQAARGIKPKESKVSVRKSSEDHSLTFHKTVVSIDVSLMLAVVKYSER